MSAAPRQLALALQHRPALGHRDFLVSESNVEAARWIAEWADWPGGRLALAGPTRAGKTHLAHVWMQASGARLVSAAALDPGFAETLAGHGRVVVEDGEALAGVAAAERGLLHLHNLLAAEGGALLLTGQEAPARWGVRLPDLASRLQAITVVRLDAPDDALLSSILIKLFADRQVRVGPDVVLYLVRRMERSIAEAERLVAELDRLSLATRRPVSRTMAIELLSHRGGDATEGG